MKRLLLTNDHAAEYERNIRVAVIAALAGTTLSFLFLTGPGVRPYALRAAVEPVAIALDKPLVEVPPDKPMPRPVRAAVPIADPFGKDTDSSLISNLRGLFDSVAVTEPVPPQSFWAVEKKPKVTSIPVPDYPELARHAGIEGNVVLHVIVGTTGRVDSAWVYVSSGNRSLDDAAKDAALRARFEPGYQRDIPVRVLMSLPFRFRLD